MVGVSFFEVFGVLRYLIIFFVVVKVFGVVIGFALVRGYTRVALACQRLNQTRSFDKLKGHELLVRG